MTITVEPFAKLDAVCAGCWRTASVVRTGFPAARERHVVCERCLADLHRLTGEARIAAVLALIETWQTEADDATRCRLGTGRRAALLGCIRDLRAALKEPTP